MASAFIDGSIIGIIKRHPFAAAGTLILLCGVGFWLLGGQQVSITDGSGLLILIVGGAVLFYLFYLFRQDERQQESQDRSTARPSPLQRFVTHESQQDGQPANAPRLSVLQPLDRATDALAEWGQRTIWGEPQRGVDKSGVDKSDQRQVIIKTYSGSQAEATMRFQADAIEMAANGYFPTSQSWAPGQWKPVAFILVLVVCFFLLSYGFPSLFVIGIGILAFIFMLIIKPKGSLAVTYERRAVSVEEKTCPRCAERIKASALVCHFCGYEFTPEAEQK